MQAGFLLSILHQQLTAVEQSWPWSKSSFQKKNRIAHKRRHCFTQVLTQIIYLSLLRISFNSRDVIVLHLS